MKYTKNDSKVENLTRRLRKFFIWSERPLCKHKARAKTKNLLHSQHSQKTTFKSFSVYTFLLAFLPLAVLGHSVQTMAPMDANVPPALAHPSPGISIPSYMMISPSSRAMDFQQAFEQLRKEKSTGKVYFELADGSTIGNVIEMTVMPNSTLIIFRFNSTQGIHFQVVKVEDIIGLRY